MYLTNVFLKQPPGNKINAYMVTLAQAKALQPGYDLPKHSPGRYVHPQYVDYLSNLRTLAEGLRPNLVLALGGTAAWACLGVSGIGAHRGFIAPSSDGPGLPRGLKVLPTWHPAAVLRNWSLRVQLMADLDKARARSRLPRDKETQA